MRCNCKRAEAFPDVAVHVHLLAYLKQEELTGSYGGALFDRTAEDARAAQIKALGTDRSGEES